MGTLIVTYAVASAAVIVYVSLLVAADVRLARRVKSLEARICERRAKETPRIRVA